MPTTKTELAAALLTTRTAYLAAVAAGYNLKAEHMAIRINAILDAMLG
jgi:hypothetical protein